MGGDTVLTYLFSPSTLLRLWWILECRVRRHAEVPITPGYDARKDIVRTSFLCGLIVGNVGSLVSACCRTWFSMSRSCRTGPLGFLQNMTCVKVTFV